MIRLGAIVAIIAVAVTVNVRAQVDISKYTDVSGLPYLKDSKLIQASSHDTTGANKDFISVLDGETATLLDAEGPGMITRIWVTIASDDPHFLRRIVLRMYWDGETEPSVEAPIGDFFGTGFEYKHYLSAFVGMSSGGYYSYFPMPFQQGARVEILNETGREIQSFYYQIDYQKFNEPLAEDVAYFHAQWKRDVRTDEDENYVVLDAEGEGHFVGVNMSMQGYNKQLWYLEGDEMVYVDGEDYPSVYGTGTEDYFTGGWYFNKGEFHGPYHGLIIKDEETARTAIYRFHVGDAIPFKEKLLFTIEHGHGNEEVADYSSTAYWYQKEPHKPFPPLPEAGMRVPLRVLVPDEAKEAETMAVVSSDAETEVEAMGAYGADWSDAAQLRVPLTEAGQRVTVAVPETIEKEYNLAVYGTKGPDYADVEIIANGEVVGTYEGYAADLTPTGPIEIGAVPSKDGVIELTFVAAGKSVASKGYAIGVDAILADPVRDFIDEWYFIGPFPNERDENLTRLGLDKVFPPEEGIDLDATYEGAGGEEISWRRVESEEDGRLHLRALTEQTRLVVDYALTYVRSPEEQTVSLLLGSDDGVKVFLNGEELHRVLDIRLAIVDQDRVELPLKKGANELLFKIENNLGGYSLYARIQDLKDNLTITPTKER
jgi:hypothetical protein